MKSTLLLIFKTMKLLKKKSMTSAIDPSAREPSVVYKDPCAEIYLELSN